MASRLVLAPLAALCFLLAVSGVTDSAPVPWGKFSSVMTGAKGVPPVKTTMMGNAAFTIWNSTYAVGRVNLKNAVDVTMAHIHLGGPKTNGPPVIWLLPSGGDAPLTTPISGNFSWSFTFDPTNFPGSDNATFMDEVTTAIKSMDTYINVHTVRFPNGIIRGQVKPNPQNCYDEC